MDGARALAWLSVFGERQGGVSQAKRKWEGRECFVQAVPRPQWGLLCKLQQPFPAGFQQKCFLYVPEMFVPLFSLARDGPLQLSPRG